MKLSALPAVSLSICSAIHPSSDLSTGGGGGAASHLKLLGQLSRDITLHPQSRNLAAEPSRGCQHAARGPALRRCHTAAAPVCIRQRRRGRICRGTRILVSRSCALNRQDVVFPPFFPVSAVVDKVGVAGAQTEAANCCKN